MVAVLALAVAACGGGGGSAEVAGAEPLPPPAELVQLRGRVTYDDVPSIQGRLDYAKTAARPVRGATLEVLAAQTGALLAKAQTDEQGQYQVTLPVRASVRLRVKAELSDTASAGARVVDNTQGNALYAIESPEFDNGVGTQDLHAGSGWTGQHYGALRAAAPFNILDGLYAARAALSKAAPAAILPPLRIHWSVHNRPARGDVTKGEIGTSHFTDEGDNIGRIYILGGADVDTDEYDDTVVTHEWAHYYQWAFSRDDSMGGSHDGGPLEMTVAFSEGWASGWAAFVAGREELSDAQGAGQGAGFAYLVTDPPVAARGWYNEQSVAQVFWSLLRTHGMEPVHRAMQALRVTPAFTAIHSFSAAVRQEAPAIADALDVELRAQGIVASSQSDAWGAGETNSADYPPGAFLPVYTPVSPDRPSVVCLSNLYGHHNRYGNHANLRLDIPAAGAWSLRAVALPVAGQAFPGSAHPIASRLQGGAREWWGLPPGIQGVPAVTWALQPGLHAVSLTDARLLQPSGDFMFQCWRLELQPMR